MFANIQAEIAGTVLPAVNKNLRAVGKLNGILKKSIYEFAGVCEIRLRLFLWELFRKARQMIAGYGLNSSITGKTAFLIISCCLFITAGILMTWQTRKGLSQEAQTVNAAGFESFYRPSRPAPVSIDRPRHTGFNGFEFSRDPGRMVPPKPEMNPRRFLAKNEIKAHPRIVFSSRD